MKSDYLPPLAAITRAVADFQEELNSADADPTGIANAIYAIGMRIGKGKPVTYIDTVCAILEDRTPNRQWNKSRQSECRTLMRRYWEINEARAALTHTGLNASYFSILAVLRITSKGHSIANAVRMRQEAPDQRSGLDRFLTRVGEAAQEAGLVLLQNYERDDNLVVVLRRPAGRKRNKVVRPPTSC